MVGLHFIYPSELQHVMVSYDAIRLFAVVAIVVLHTAANGVNRLDFASTDWWLANLTDSAARAAVPLFVMLTGALLLNQPLQALRHFYQKRWQRMGLALCGFSLFYLCWSQLKALVKGQQLSSDDLWLQLVSGTPYFHLWYLYMLVGLYLVLPFLQRLWQPLPRQQQGQLVVASLVLQQLSFAMLFVEQHPLDFVWPVWFIAYLPYLLLGGWLGLLTEQKLTNKSWLFFAIALCSLLIAGGHFGQLLAQQQGLGPAWLQHNPVFYAYSYTSLPMLFCALLLWQLLGHSKRLATTSQQPIAKRIVQHSLAIYCIHPVFLDVTTMLLQRLPADLLPYAVLLPMQSMLILLASFACCLCWDWLRRAIQNQRTSLQ